MFRPFKRFAGLAVALLALSMTSAFATPPRSVLIHDNPVAYTQTHLFLVRTVEDNIGLHHANLIHRFLVRQRLSDGAVDSHWLMRRSLVLSPEETKPPQILEPVPSQGPWARWRYHKPLRLTNLDERLREESATPLSPFQISSAHSRHNSYAISPRFGLVSGLPEEVFGDEKGFYTIVPLQLPDETDPKSTLPDESKVVLTPDRVRSQLEASLLPTLKWLKEHEAPIDVKTNLMAWDEGELPLDLDICQVRQSTSLPTASEKSFVEIDCEADTEIARIRTWLSW